MMDRSEADAYFVTVREESSPDVEFEDWVENSPVYKLNYSGHLPENPVLPKSAIRKDERPLNDAFWVEPNGNAVSARFKAIIEAAEPGVHRFFPLQIKNADGTLVDEPYFMFAVCQESVCVLPDKSESLTPLRVRFGPNAGMPGMICHDSGLTLSRPAVGQKKVFCTSLVAGGKLIVSKEIGDQLIDDQITELRIHEVKLSDEVWSLEKHAPLFAEWFKDHPEQLSDFFD